MRAAWGRSLAFLAMAGCAGAHSVAPGAEGTTSLPVVAHPQHVVLSQENYRDESLRVFEVYDGALRNPERGLMQPIDIFQADDVLYVQAQGGSLGIAQINLSSFRQRRLSVSYLAEIREGLARVRQAGLKLVLRFEYDTQRGEDASLRRVLEHIEQLTPILRENADVIAVLQAGFVGAWGEWHSSKHGLDTEASRYAILRKLLVALPETRKLQVRSPVYKEQALQYGALSADSTLSGERIGYHNDCLLADETDQNTYPSERWRRYVDADRPDLPVGGETCQENAPRTNCGNAIYEMRHQRWSFVNRSYHPDVIAAWKAQGCLAIIDRDLGYRFALRSAHLPQRLKPGNNALLRVELENLGYALPYNPRRVFAVLDGPGGRFELPIDGWNPQTWMPDGIISLETTLAIPLHVPPGTYSLALWLPDSAEALQHLSAYSIRMANEGIWDSEDGLNELGEVRVE